MKRRTRHTRKTTNNKRFPGTCPGSCAPPLQLLVHTLFRSHLRPHCAPFSPTPSPPTFATVGHRPNLAHLPRPRLLLNRPLLYNTQPRISHTSPRQAYHSHSALYNTNPPCGTKKATQACARAQTQKKKDTSSPALDSWTPTPHCEA